VNGRLVKYIWRVPEKALADGCIETMPCTPRPSLSQRASAALGTSQKTILKDKRGQLFDLSGSFAVGNSAASQGYAGHKTVFLASLREGLSVTSATALIN